jgi:hypothetical protein
LLDRRSWRVGRFLRSAGVLGVFIVGGCSSGGAGNSNRDGGGSGGGIGSGGSTTNGTGGTEGGGGSGGGGIGGASGNTGSGGLTSGAGGSNGVGGSGGSAGGAPTQLSPIPGQDPTAVTTTGAPITLLASTAVNATSTVRAIAIDGIGNVITVANGSPGQVILRKLDSQLTQLWTTTIMSFSLDALAGYPNPLAVDTSGNIFIGGATRGTTSLAAVVKYLPGGTASWTETIGSATTAQNGVDNVAIGPNETIFAIGGSAGQLPQQPATASGTGFELQYSNDGTLIQALQSATFNNFDCAALQVDSLGNSVFLSATFAKKVNPSFGLSWSVGPARPQIINVAVLPDGSAAYTVELDDGNDYALVKRDSSTGAAIWSRSFGTQMANLNAVEGEVWNGRFSTVGAQMWMLASADAIYLAGTYNNAYVNGSSPPPGSTPAFVARLDLTGQQLWFRQYRISSQADFTPTAFVQNAAKLALVGNARAVMVLNASDGSVP